MKTGLFPVTDRGYSSSGSSSNVAQRNESLKNCVYANWDGYKRKTYDITLIIQRIREFLKDPFYQTVNFDERISFWEKYCIERDQSWSASLEAWKFLKSKNADPAMIEQGINHFEEKRKISDLVSKVFENIHISSEFQTQPMEYIKKWKAENSSQQKHKKIIKRLDSIQGNGHFSCAGNFYIKMVKLP